MSTFPRITSLVLKARAAAFDNADWLFELKYNGFRGCSRLMALARLVSRNRNRCRTVSRYCAGTGRQPE
jgi:hypothetical protein